MLLKDTGRDDEAEASYKKAIELNPDFAQAYNNLGITLQKLNKLEDAELSYKKAIELKPDYAEAHNSLGNILLKNKKINKSENSFKKAIELKPDFVDAHNNLRLLLNLKKLLLKIDESKINKNNISNLDSNNDAILNPFISNREVEVELINKLYKMKTTKLSAMKTGPLFGTGITSNFYLFEDNSPVIKNLEKDLIKIMRQVVKSEVYISDSFFNIMSDGGGSKSHMHLNEIDKIFELNKRKYSLQYYLSVGDQNSSYPGFFEMKNPDEKILPSNGMILIIPANRTHSAIYNGKIDRVMIGVNFYSLI